MFGEADGRKDGGSATVRVGLESLSEETLPAKQNKLPVALLSAFSEDMAARVAVRRGCWETIAVETVRIKKSPRRTKASRWLRDAN